MTGLAAILPMLNQSVECALIVRGQISEVRDRIDGDFRNGFSPVRSCTLTFKSAGLSVQF